LKDKRLFLGKKGWKKKKELLDPKGVGAPKTFEHIAAMAFNISQEADGYRGIDALGVLKADVDNLGLLMSCGMEPDRFTPARLLTLSRQVNWYFALYLPHLLKVTPQFNDIYTVFAGGDDLFLIGPWNRVVELARVLHKTFAEYVCQNDKIHFSAGISLHKTHAPLDKLAHETEAAIGKSKDEGRNRITLFNETADWDEFLLLQGIKDKLLEWRESKLINNAMLYRLDEFIAMAEEAKLVLEQQEIHIEQMQCLKWRALFHYTAARNVGRDVKAETPKQKELKKAEMVNEFSCAVDWLATYGARLKIALWDVIYNQRKGA
jgi:CRISPR-associated protein Csm1